MSELVRICDGSHAERFDDARDGAECVPRVAAFAASNATPRLRGTFDAIYCLLSVRHFLT